jgi:hypothetical protein
MGIVRDYADAIREADRLAMRANCSRAEGAQADAKEAFRRADELRRRLEVIVQHYEAAKEARSSATTRDRWWW